MPIQNTLNEIHKTKGKAAKKERSGDLAHVRRFGVSRNQ
jgi:hypothetical protein